MQRRDFVIETTGPLSAEQIQELADLGLDITSTLGTHVYRLRGERAADAAALQAKPYIAGVSAYDPDHKVDAALISSSVRPGILAVGRATASVRVLIQLDPKSGSDATLARLPRSAW